ncbi:MAG: FkbM family methyltransferase [Devosiaceae bacterium]|nr:FkbM family methyltransferase [Devosiaceae bacterium MH13]
MDALHRQFVQAGDLAFDLGAHVGDRTGSFLRLGARVVAIEPQALPFRALRLIYSSSPEVTLLQAAVDAHEGTVPLHINRTNPTVSTVSKAFVAAAAHARAWQGQQWDALVQVRATTLDRLIAQHGMPAFTKIDVEGHEHAVLCGLSTALPALSFEFTTIQRGVAYDCLERLTALGNYRFNVSLGEAHSMLDTEWLSASSMADTIRALPEDANSGDVFARLQP